jgi:hypothetical protein
MVEVSDAVDPQITANMQFHGCSKLTVTVGNIASLTQPAELQISVRILGNMRRVAQVLVAPGGTGDSYHQTWDITGQEVQANLIVDAIDDPVAAMRLQLMGSGG